MHTILSVVVVAILAFLGTMFDNFFAFAAQLIVTEKKRFRRVSYAQALGVAHAPRARGRHRVVAHADSRCRGSASSAWRRGPWPGTRGATATKPPSEVFRRGALTTFAMTLALGGDNLAVWIPLLRADGFFHSFVTVAVFAVMELVFIVCAQRVSSHPRLVAWGTKHAPSFLPWLYFGLGRLDPRRVRFAVGDDRSIRR